MAHELPEAARARLARIRESHTWDSALSAAEFGAIKSVGFDPVGQVFGASVHKIGIKNATMCPTYGAMQRRDARPVHAEVSSSGPDSAFGHYVQALYEARRTVLRRMMSGCATLGGSGIVGVSLTAGKFQDAGLEFTATGTAIRAPAGWHLNTSFTSDVSGQEFAELIMAGCIPASLVFGISIGVRHDDWIRGKLARRRVANVEIAGYTELLNVTRRDARGQLAINTGRAHAIGVLVQRIELETGEYECPAIMGTRDRWVEATIIGTAIKPLPKKLRQLWRPTVATLALD